MAGHATAGAGESDLTKTFTLRGKVPGKKDALRPRRGRGKGLMYDRVTSEQIMALTWQIKSEWIGKKPLEHPDITVTFYIKHERRDRDNMLATVLDCLVTAGVLVDDNAAHCNGLLVLAPAVVGAEEGATVQVEWRE